MVGADVFGGEQAAASGTWVWMRCGSKLNSNTVRSRSALPFPVTAAIRVGHTNLLGCCIHDESGWRIFSTDTDAACACGLCANCKC